MDRSRPPVIFVTTYPPDHCGVGRDAYRLVEALRPLRAIRVMASQVPAPPLPDPTVRMVWRKGDPLYPFRIARAVAEADPTGRAIVHIHHHFFLYGRVASVAEFPLLLTLLRLRGFRVVVHFHSVIDPTEIDPKFSPVPRLPGAVVGRGLGLFYRTVERLTDAIAVCTPSMKRLLERPYGVAPSHVWRVPVGWRLSESPPPPGPPSGAAGTDRVVLFHGFLDPTKGLEELIDAFATLARDRPGLRLVLAGEVSPEIGAAGPAYVEALRRRAEERGVGDRVRTTGFLDEAALATTLASADVIALPYTMRFSHGGSAVLSRVAGLGRPLVASSISRFADEVADGREALLVPPSDVPALASAIGRLLDDPVLAERLGRNLRSLAETRSWPSVAALLDRELYPALSEGAST